jgi:hypothetical protein
LSDLGAVFVERSGFAKGGDMRHTSVTGLRVAVCGATPPAQTIRSTKLYHRQVYSFAYHRPKLTLMPPSSTIRTPLGVTKWRVPPAKACL